MDTIKLLINIPKQMYLNAKADMLCGGDILVSAIKNGVPHETVTEFADRCRECGREKVLDKIRGEIKAASHGKWYVGRVDGRTEEVLLMDEVMEIIDKYKEGEE